MNQTGLPLHSQRIHGLDTLRALAIVLVMMYHYMVFVSNEPSFGIFSEIGWVGVDLFFVLSGFLIGDQIFKELAQDQTLRLGRFYGRRALRTLPNYLAILAVYLIFPLQAGGNPVTPLWQFLSFTQNLHLLPGSAFSHAWSLCVEEQFYFVLPILALLSLAFCRSVKAMWSIIGISMLLCALMRYLMLSRVGNDGGLYRTYIYYPTWGRFDELMPGVALALLKNFHSQRWQTYLARGSLNLVLGTAISVAAIALFHWYSYDSDEGFLWFATTFGYSLLSVGFAIVVLAALSPNNYLSRWRIPGAQALALSSYALYLLHKPLMNALILPLEAQGLHVGDSSTIAIMFGMSILVALGMYRYWETPMMNLRKRWFP